MVVEKLKEFIRFTFSEPPIPERPLSRGVIRVVAIPTRWKIAGGWLIALFAALGILSPAFSVSTPLTKQPILPAIGIMIAAGLGWLFICELLIHTRSSKVLMLWILAVGTIMRLLMLPSRPILEVDYFRYLWDGAVTANGYNPYAYAPAVIAGSPRDEIRLPPGLKELAQHRQAHIDRINHARLRTIYPPVVQGAFALAYLIKPWSLASWRVILLFFDIFTLIFLLLILRHLELSPRWAGLYWLNPLLVKETFNSGHMDLLAFPFVLGALWYSLRQRPFRSLTALALSIGVKVWPVALLPVLIRPLWPDYKRAVMAVALLAVLCGLIFYPVILAGFGETSGYTAYAQSWQLNDSLFRIILRGSEALLPMFDIHPGHAQRLARVIVFLLSSAWILYLTFQKSGDPCVILDQCLLITAGIFLLSPTQFPWYYTWMLPFLVFSRRRSLLLLTVLLPLYYLWYYFSAHGQEELFHHWIVWIEFGPVWALIFREWYLSRQKRLMLPPEVLPDHEK